MKKLTFLIIFFIFLLISLLGFSFAYLGQNDFNIENNSHTQINFTNETAFQITSTGDDDVTVTISALDMYYRNEDTLITNESFEVSNTTKTFNLTLDYSAGNPNTTLVCDYDYVFDWQNNSSQYSISDNGIKEFTIEIEDDNLVDNDGNYLEANLPNYGDQNNVIGSSFIEASGGTVTQIDVPVNFRFYNLEDVDQGNHAGQTYIGKVDISNIRCQAS